MSRQDEKMIAVPMPGEEWALEGIFTGVAGDEPAGAVLAPPHPLYGGSMESPVVGELAWACRRADYATVRFNWRGVGASGGSPSGEPADADADYAAALGYLADTVPGPLLAAGYSFGAATAPRVAAAHPRVRRLLLVAPPPALLDAESVARLRGRLLVLVGSEDHLAPHPEIAALLGGADGADPKRRLEIVPGADHFFGSGLAELGRFAADWLAA